jgi:hypothetical protein
MRKKTVKGPKAGPKMVQDREKLAGVVRSENPMGAEANQDCRIRGVLSKAWPVQL